MAEQEKPLIGPKEAEQLESKPKSILSDQEIKALNNAGIPDNLVKGVEQGRASIVQHRVNQEANKILKKLGYEVYSIALKDNPKSKYNIYLHPKYVNKYIQGKPDYTITKTFAPKPETKAKTETETIPSLTAEEMKLLEETFSPETLQEIREKAAMFPENDSSLSGLKNVLEKLGYKLYEVKDANDPQKVARYFAHPEQIKREQAKNPGYIITEVDSTETATPAPESEPETETIPGLTVEEMEILKEAFIPETISQIKEKTAVFSRMEILHSAMIHGTEVKNALEKLGYKLYKVENTNEPEQIPNEYYIHPEQAERDRIERPEFIITEVDSTETATPAPESEPETETIPGLTAEETELLKNFNFTGPDEDTNFEVIKNREGAINPNDLIDHPEITKILDKLGYKIYLVTVKKDPTKSFYKLIHPNHLATIVDHPRYNFTKKISESESSPTKEDSPPTPDTLTESEKSEKFNSALDLAKEIRIQFSERILADLEPTEKAGALKVFEQFKTLWRKNLKFRIGISLGLTGISLLSGGSAPAILVGSVATYRIISGLVGNTLTHNTVTASMDETRFLRKQVKHDNLSTAQAAVKSAGAFFKTLWSGNKSPETETKSTKLSFQAVKQRAATASQAASEAFRAETFLTADQLNQELEAISNPVDQLKYIQDKLAGTYAIAKEKGVKIAEIAGEDVINNVLLKRYEEILPQAIAKIFESGSPELATQIAQGEELSPELQSAIRNEIEEQLGIGQNFDFLLENAQTKEKRHQLGRLTRSLFYGALTTGLTLGLPALNKKITELGAKTEVQDLGIKTVEPVSKTAFLPEGTTVETANNGNKFLRIFGKLYQTEGGAGERPLVPVDIQNHDGIGDIGPDGVIKVAIDPETGFGEYIKDGVKYVVHADDKDLGGDLEGLIAREGQMVDINGNGTFDAQIWKDAKTGEWRASHMGAIETPGLKAAEFTWDDANEAPPAYLNDTQIPAEAQEVFGREFKFNHFIAEGPDSATQAKDLATQFETYMQSSYNLNTGRINELAAQLAPKIEAGDIDINYTTPDNPILTELYNSESVQRAAESGKDVFENFATVSKQAFSTAAKNAAKYELIPLGHNVVNVANRKPVIEIITRAVKNYSPEDRQIITNLLNKTQTVSVWTNSKGEFAIIDSAASTMNQATKFISNTSIESLANYKR